MDDCKFTERGWLGYVTDIITMGGYTVFRVNTYTDCIRLNYPKASRADSYRRYMQEVGPLINRTVPGDNSIDTGQSKDTTR